MKTIKKVPVFYNEIQHIQEQGKAHENVMLFNEAKTELETIIKKPIDDYLKFKSDVLGYAITSIKKTFPNPFELGLSEEETFKMLSIDLSNLKRINHILTNSPYNFVVDAKGEATTDENKEPYTLYAETDEQLERLNFANELIANLEKAHSYNLHVHKSNLNAGVSHIVAYSPIDGLIPNYHFVIN